jgi:hypothetical protein
MYNFTGHNVTMTCETCPTETRVVDIHHVVIRTPTGNTIYTRRDVHPRGSVTGRVETRRFAFGETVSVTKRVCPACKHKLDRAVRRGVCQVSEL